MLFLIVLCSAAIISNVLQPSLLKLLTSFLIPSKLKKRVSITRMLRKQLSYWFMKTFQIWTLLQNQLKK